MTITLMEQEARQTPTCLTAQYQANETVLKALSDHIARTKPTIAMTIARGSSDHAATFAKYLLETQAGIITASAAPSVLTLYQKQLPLKNVLVLGISQSGASPDIVETFISARNAGAITAAFVNEADSPLARAAEYVIPLHAGKEQAVAATKTYLATLGALLDFTAHLTGNIALHTAVNNLPDKLLAATKQDWSDAILAYQNCRNTLVVGRGYSFPIAQEAALKFKETAKIHAEAFSGAELLHGPFALVEPNFPILLFAQEDISLTSMLTLGKRVKALGAHVLLATSAHHHPEVELNEASTTLLPLPSSLHPLCDPLIQIQAFYIMMARLSIARGLNPDTPAHLTKVTKTW